ncbi:hypothetical protein F4776DRAFT_461664 [Hypoxylon sp. NC0597]|nr:hypothetical protein F4776DRAFT_461664 [Hypoxylon sp. NC0597]
MHVSAYKFHGTNARDPGSWLGQHKTGTLWRSQSAERMVAFTSHTSNARRQLRDRSVRPEDEKHAYLANFFTPERAEQNLHPILTGRRLQLSVTDEARYPIRVFSGELYYAHSETNRDLASRFRAEMVDNSRWSSGTMEVAACHRVFPPRSTEKKRVILLIAPEAWLLVTFITPRKIALVYPFLFFSSCRLTAWRSPSIPRTIR